MFALTIKSKHAVTAVLDLTRHYESGLLQLRDISERNNIPAPYLIQILNRLTKLGIVKTQRGNKGGYTLARKPKEITLLETLQAMEGEMMLSSFYMEDPAVGDIFNDAEEALRQKLAISMADLLTISNQRNGALFFEI